MALGQIYKSNPLPDIGTASQFHLHYNNLMGKLLPEAAFLVFGMKVVNSGSNQSSVRGYSLGEKGLVAAATTPHQNFGFLSQVMAVAARNNRMVYIAGARENSLYVTGDNALSCRVFHFCKPSDLQINPKMMPANIESLAVAPLTSGMAKMGEPESYPQHGFFVLTSTEASAFSPLVELEFFNNIRLEAAEIVAAKAITL